MRSLHNPKHEMFAQGLAEGLSAAEAYRNAGYSPNRAAASRLRHHANIVQRVQFLLAEKARKHEKATAKALESLALTREWVLSRLAQNAEAALADNDRGAANRALELIGKEQGMFIERRETGQPGDFSALESVDAIIAELRTKHGDAMADALAKALTLANQSDSSDDEPEQLEPSERGDESLN